MSASASRGAATADSLSVSPRRSFGPALLALGLLALARAARPVDAVTALARGDRERAWAASDRAAALAGEPIDLRLGALTGPRFRLLPGVGPVLAERLEQARAAAGGVLDEAGAAAVPGVGPVRLASWRALWGEAAATATAAAAAASRPPVAADRAEHAAGADPGVDHPLRNR